MWKGAFPTAPSSAEKEEIQWVKANFDFTHPTGAKEDMRLAGTWVPIDVARFLAPSYNLTSQFTHYVSLTCLIGMHFISSRDHDPG